MRRDELQGRCLLAKGWATKQLVRAALKEARGRSDVDLVGVLVRHGRLEPGRADRVRRWAEKKLAERGLALPGLGAEPPPAGRGATLRVPVLDEPSPIRRPTPDRFEASSGSDEWEPAPLPGLGPRPSPAAPDDMRNFVVDSDVFAEAMTRGRGMVGRRFRGYELIGELSRGAMGIVYRARDLEKGRQVAVKFMQETHPGEEEVVRFKREVGVLARLDHPNIVQVYDFGVEHGLLYFVMELIEGRDLLAIIQETLMNERRAPEWERIALIMRSIAKAIAYCHKTGIVHRDVKPQNILVESETDRAVLVDFGLIKKDRTKIGSSMMSQGQSLTQKGDLIGTPAYMSPEQFSPGGSFGRVGACSDVWGFGASLFHALAGVPPYNRSTAMEIFQDIMTFDPPRLQSRNSRVPGWLDHLCAACLQRQAERRPTMDRVVEYLDKCVVPLEVVPDKSTAMPIEVATGKVPLSKVTPRPPESSDSVRLAPGGRSLLPVAGVIAAVSLLIIVALLWPSTPELVRLTAEQTWTRRSRVTIVGAVDHPDVELLVRNRSKREPPQRVRSEADGTFQATVKLEAGENRIAVALGEREHELVVTLDSAPPALRIDDIVAGPTRLLTEREVGLKRGDRLTWTVEDASPVTVKVDGGVAKPDSRGTYTLELAGQPVRDVRIIAEDKAGHRSDRRLFVVSAKEQQRRLRLLRLLNSSKRWKGADSSEREATLKVVEHRLGADFQCVGSGIQKNAVGSATGHFGVFKHLRTGLILHLIPGGPLQPGSELSERREAEAEIRRALARLDRVERFGRWAAVALGDAESLEATVAAVQSIKAEQQTLEQRLAMLKFWLLIAERGLDVYARIEAATGVTSSVDAVFKHLDEHRDQLPKIESLARSELAWPTIKAWLEEQLEARSEILRSRLGIGEPAGNRAGTEAVTAAIRKRVESSLEGLVRAQKIWISASPGAPVERLGARRLELARQVVAAGERRRSIERAADMLEFERRGSSRHVEPFLIGRDEVPLAVFDPDRRRDRSGGRAAVKISWIDALAWCRKFGLRLPTEMEWEYACRAKTTSPWFWGREPNPTYADCLGADGLQPGRRGPAESPGEVLANAFGLLDMSGGVREWCLDAWRNQHDDKDPAGVFHGAEAGPNDFSVVRGGSRSGLWLQCRSAARDRLPRSARRPDLGFRVALSLP